MIVVRVLAVCLTAVLTVAAPALARDVSIAAFMGQWSGNGLSESADSVYFQLTARDLDVQIKPAPSGFSVSWTTVQRQKGDTRAPTAVDKTTTLTFAATDKRNVWRATEAGDPMGSGYAWARIKESTLTISIMQVASDGGFELQVFDRTLSGNGMELRFARFRDGERVRTAKGRLVKVAR
jgi:hypothetical protein